MCGPDDRDLLDILAKLEALSVGPAWAYLRSSLRKIRAGTITMPEFRREVAATLAGLERLNRQGDGFLGDLDALAAEIQRLLEVPPA